MLKYVFAIGAIAILSDAKPPQKIIGGDVVISNEFPFIVSIRIDGQHHCSGSIISSKHILTAAHCVVHLDNSIYPKLCVISGTISSINGGESHQVKLIRYHESFNTLDKSSPNDIAIIELEKPMIFNAAQHEISIASSANWNGGRGIAIGWGFRAVNLPFMSPELRKVELEIIGPKQCQYLSSTQLWTHQICARGYPGYGTCIGDSGGPLIYNNELIGVLSYGTPCAVGKPDVFTSTYHYYHWIYRNMA
ncbi:hypothetical protein PV328_001388 [Microctonus aethiopoides]|uniref:Peptidase S1 domain-containing protein n=1 Tax=Microctonus aethiopoides TaxID=144406 RepID=A0AA39FXJ4_9HYME|nr:hypothetical protein PV328_001388 [Microctonus aethiopoides]